MKKTKPIKIYSFLVSFLFSHSIVRALTYPPQWITSHYIRASSADIITTRTGNSSTPTAIIPFSSAFTQVPNLGYGAISYMGADALGEQKFEINRTSLTTSYFSVLVQIRGFTNINFLTVRFIAIDSLFPHNLNSYDNVPVNYSRGPLVNISVQSTSSTSISVYRNTINFTNQSISLPYKYFSTPLTNNKILLFMTSMFLDGTNQNTTAFNIRVTIQIEYRILTNQTYQLIVSLGSRNRLLRLHFSMIIFDQADIQASGRYMLIYRRINIYYTGAFLPLPQQFMDNFMIGLTNFTTRRTMSNILFKWEFVSLNGTFGIQTPEMFVNKPLEQPVRSLGFSYIYLKTWICPNNTSFYENRDICTNCLVDNCLQCYNFTYCSQCDSQNGYFLNLSTGLCTLCYVDNCLQCYVIPQNSANLSSYSYIEACIQCDFYNGYGITNNLTCQKCLDSNNIFLNASSLKCQECTLNNCLICQNLFNCSICNLSNSFYLDYENRTCLFCSNIDNYFINTTSGLCVSCQLQGCLSCLSLTACINCNSNLSYFLNLSTNICQICSLQGCLFCQSLTQCLQCNVLNGYGFNQSQPNLTNCVNQCSFNCICDGYVLPWDAFNRQCSPLCGDGLIRLNESCDDNNIVNGDGCSDSCQVQPGFSCSGQPSMCNDIFNPIQIKIENLSTYKTGCNQFQIQILFNLSVQQMVRDVEILNQWLIVKSINVQKNRMMISIDYNKSTFDERIQIEVFGNLLNITPSQIRPYLFYEEDSCSTFENINILMNVILICSYVVMFLSLFTYKIVGLEMFGLLQMSYFTLASQQFVVLYLQPLKLLRVTNGLAFELVTTNETMPQILHFMGHHSTYINNCNLMIFFMIILPILGAFLYQLTKLIKSQRLMQICEKIIKQGFITSVLFNTFNISFSVITHFKFSGTQTIAYPLGNFLISVSLICVLVSIFVFQCSSDQNYGEFKDKFKDCWHCKLYIPISIIYRFAIGCYTAFNYDYAQGTLIVISFSFIFILYNITNLPFKDFYQNYRANIIHISQLIILFVRNFYRSMKKNTPLMIKGYIFTPAVVEIVVIGVCVGVSVLILSFEIFKGIRSFIRQKRRVIADMQSKNTTQSIETFA